MTERDPAEPAQVGQSTQPARHPESLQPAEPEQPVKHGYFEGDRARLASREARRILRHTEERWERRRSDEDAALDTFLWLRAGRAAWLLGTTDVAQRWYSIAADELLDLALGQGSSTGTYAYYAELALGAASLSDRGGVLGRVADVIRTHPAPLPTQRPRMRFGRGTGLSSGAVSPEASAVAHEVLRAWGAWIAGDKREATLAVVGTARAVSGLRHQEEQRWRASRWPDMLAVLEGLVDGLSDRVLTGLTALEAKLHPHTREDSSPHHRSHPGVPTAEDALPSHSVHETLIALVAEWRRAFPRTYSTDVFRLPVEPGALAPHP